MKGDIILSVRGEEGGKDDLVLLGHILFKHGYMVVRSDKYCLTIKNFPTEDIEIIEEDTENSINKRG